MASFHNKFRSDFKTIHALATTYEKRGLSFPRFVDYALSFNENLGVHHGIEETYVFPALAERMPEFAEDHEHKESHKLIHDGLDKYCDYLKLVKSAPNKYDGAHLQSLMDSLGSVLFKHLEEEERSLGKENMQKYWTLEELKRLPM